MTASNHQKHEAGRHFAIAHALLRGYTAHLVGPHRYVEINGLRAVVMLAGMGAWQIADVDEFLASKQTRYILVGVTDTATAIYVVPGDKLREDVRNRHAAFMASVGGTRPRNPTSKHSKIVPAQVAQWRDQWSLFEIDGR